MRGSGKKFKVGYTQGAFDMFHIGHLNLINRAKEQCETLIVGVNSDELVCSYKKRSPVIGEKERAEIVRNLKSVDRTLVVHTLDKMEILKGIPFDAVFIGDDWKGFPRWQKTEKDLGACGIKVIYLPYTKEISTTLLRIEKEHVTDGF